MDTDILRQAQRSGILPGLPDKHFIDGRWVASANGGTMESFDPGSASPHAT